MDTGVVEKDAKPDYRPGFMNHFDEKDKQKKKVGRKHVPQGPHDISYYFPDIPDGMDFRDFVSTNRIVYWHWECFLWLGNVNLSTFYVVENADSATVRGVY